MSKLSLATLLTLCASTAQAWPTPELAINEFLTYELNGGRLSSDTYAQYAEHYVHLPQDHEEAGWDSVLVVSSFSLGAMQCTPTSCDIAVTFALPPTDTLDGPPVINESGDTQEISTYKILNKNGDWRVLAPDDFPRLSLSAYEKF